MGDLNGINTFEHRMDDIGRTRETECLNSASVVRSRHNAAIWIWRDSVTIQSGGRDA